jgi:hypothetical protein
MGSEDWDGFEVMEEHADYVSSAKRTFYIGVGSNPDSP